MLTFDDFRKLALDKELPGYKKVGFGKEHRADKEKNVFPDMKKKIPGLSNKDTTIIDIGCGCSLPVLELIKNANSLNQEVILVDNDEMLENISDGENITKYPHQFPNDKVFVDEYAGKADVVIIYSVIHAIYEFQNIFTLIDRAVSLLKERGSSLLIGDISNYSKKQRFLNSPYGNSFHKKWSNTDEDPKVDFSTPYEHIDDSIIMQIMLRYRLQGLETYLLPQSEEMPLNNTREDILIVKN